MVLKRRATISCCLWTSRWLRTSAHSLLLDGRRKSFTHPSRPGRRLPSLDKCTPLPGRRLQLCTPWPLCTKLWTSPDLTPQLSKSCLVQQTWPCYKSHSTSHRKFNGQLSGAGVPLMAKPHRNYGGWQGSFPQLAGLPHGAVWTCRRVLCRSRPRQCDTSCLSALALQPPPVAPDLHQFSSQQNLRRRPLSPLRSLSPASAPPFPNRQGLRPKIALDPVPQASSWSSRQEEEGAKSRHRQTTHQTPSVMSPSTPFSSGCGWQCVYCRNCCEYEARVKSAHTNSRCDSRKSKTNIFKKRANFLFHLSRMSSPLTATHHPNQSNPLLRGPRPGRPSPECRTGFWGL